MSVLGLALIIYIAVQPPVGDMIKKRQAEILAAERAVGEIT